jgi:hypothetical protein
VRAHLNVALEHASNGVDTIWADRAKASVLALLQDRVVQVSGFGESCRSALALVHKVMFHLNDQPVGLQALMEHFEIGDAIYRFVR